MEKEYLHLLINEEIYRISDQSEYKGLVNEPQNQLAYEQETVQSNEVAELVADQENNSRKEEQEPHKANKEHHDTPEIPNITVGEIEELDFAVFHSSKEKAELDLIHKIIDACKLAEGTYKIFGDGFDESVQFKKALVFVNTGKKYYEPIQHKMGSFLCSRPASVLMNDQNQKIELWNALKAFLNIS